MGINGLWPLLEPTCSEITLDGLEGKRLAIDVSLWIYQAQNGFGNFDARDSRSKNPHLTLLLNRVAKLLFYKIRPVFVFDGEEVPRFKKQLLRDRMLKRHLDEMSISKVQKRKLEHAAKNQRSFIEHPTGTKQNEADDFFLPSTSEALLAYESANSSESESDEVENSIEAQIARLEEMKERRKSRRLHTSEIPKNSREFSNYQLARLIGRNKQNLELAQLKSERVRRFINLPAGEQANRIIVVDKRNQTHILQRDSEIQIIEKDDTSYRQEITWPQFVKNHHPNENELQKYGKDAQGSCSKDTAISSADEDEFVDVSDLEDIPLQFPRDDMNVGGSSTVNEIEEISQISHVDWENTYNEDPDGDNVIDLDEIEVIDEQQNFSKTKKGEVNFMPTKEEKGIYTDCQNLLKLLGVPFLQAPGEAEAQCVELERLGLVTGIVSDDSDVWLFGAKTVYKNMFSRGRHLQVYRANEIHTKLGLRRGEFIQLAMLAGGDYTRGLEKVGMVTALELVSEFITLTDSAAKSEFEKALSSLKNIGKWILSKRDSENASKHFNESTRQIRLRRTIESHNSDVTLREFPNEEVFSAYAEPKVDSCSKQFHWDRIDFGKLERFVQEKLGLTKQKLNLMTHGAFERWNTFMEQSTRDYQMRITDFARPIDKFDGMLGSDKEMAPTQRVQKALEGLRRAKESTSNDDDDGGPTKKRRGTRVNKMKDIHNGRKLVQNKRERRSRRKRTEQSPDGTKVLNLSEESSSAD